MSLSYKCSLTLDFTAVFDKEALAAIALMPEEAKKVLDAEPDMHPKRRALGEAMVKAHEEGGLEGLCMFFLRDSAKQMRDLVMSEAGSEFRKFAPPRLEVASKSPKVSTSESTAFLDKRSNAVN